MLKTCRKREHLLTQIRDQAAQIQKLMEQLENTNRSSASESHSRQNGLTPHSNGAELHSPMLSPSSTNDSYFDADPAPTKPNANQDVIDWISKARESIEAFGGFIGMGGAGMPKSLLVNGDPEDSESSGEEDYMYDEDGRVEVETRRGGTEGEYGFEVEESDGEDIPISDHADEGRSSSQRHASDGRKPVHRQRSFASSVGTSQHTLPRKKDSGSEKLATLPTEASPWGLMAGLSLKNGKRRSSADRETGSTAGAELGVANADFFRASEFPASQEVEFRGIEFWSL
jgi:hypothetical protein